MFHQLPFLWYCNAPADDVAVLPAELLGQAANSAVLAAGLEAEDTESLGDDHALLGVVRGRDTLEDLQAVHGSLAASSLVGNHSADGLVEDARRGTEVEGTVGLVEAGSLAEVGMVLHCSRGSFESAIRASFRSHLARCCRS